MTPADLAGWQDDFAAALQIPQRPATVLDVSAHLTGSADLRLNVHRNNVFNSLITVLRELYPVTAQLLGDEFFRGLAGEYARARLPRSAAMLEYGHDFPRYAGAHPACSELPWLADVCQLELARHRAYHAPDARPLEASAVSALAPEVLLEQRLVLLPSLQLLASDWASRSLWEAHQSEPVDLANIALDVREYSAVLRPRWEVLVIRLDEPLLELLRLLQTGRALGAALDHITRAFPRFQAGPALAFCIREGCFARIAKETPL